MHKRKKTKKKQEGLVFFIMGGRDEFVPIATAAQAQWSLQLLAPMHWKITHLPGTPPSDHLHCI